MFHWDEKYSVGIQSIDNQHKEIFGILNKLLEAMKMGYGNDVTTQIIQELERYAVIHFQKEEFFFQRFKYQSSTEHIAEHQYFIKKIAILKPDLKSGKMTLTIDLLNFLKDWIEHHILIVDKQYSECFRQNGLK
jgi:methyl-accepting chemotaxis protein/hemerythrin